MRVKDLLEVGKFQYPVQQGPDDDNAFPADTPKKTKNDRPFVPRSARSFKFTSKSGVEYSIFLSRVTMHTGIFKSEILEIMFGIPEEGTKKIKTDASGTGDSIKIFSTVYNILKKDLEENGFADRIVFSGNAKEPTRINLYDSIVNNIQKYLPKYRLLDKRYRKYSDYWEYILIKK